MPVKRSKHQLSKASILGIILVVVALSVLSFAQGGAYRNLLVMFACVAAVVVGVVLHVKDRSRQKLCDVYTRATVAKVRAVNDDYFLDVRYNVLGQEVNSTVSYHESRYPGIGEDVGLYYCGATPSLCMLKIYKEHRMSWSDMTPKAYRRQLRYLAIGAIVFLGIGIGLFAIQRISGTNFTHTATGYVVGYEEQFNVHTPDTPGTYEYTPIVEYDMYGTVQRARSIQSPFYKSYKEGQQVVVHYNLDNPEVVVIEGDHSSDLCAALLCAMGLLVLYALVVQLRKRSKIYQDIEDVKNGIKFI